MRLMYSSICKKFHTQESTILMRYLILEKHDLKVISIDKEKLQIGCSIKQLSPDPFEHISNYEIGVNIKLK